MSAASLVVWKVGGSVLTGVAAYRGAAEAIRSARRAAPHERLVVVVSAEFGRTDALTEEARSYQREPDPQALDLLWSTGETQSVARLTLALRALGVDAAGLNAHATGLTITADGGTALNPLRIRALVHEHEVLVAPGFLARGAADALQTLGRGGSDLSAVRLAEGLGAARCELIKDVPGYYSADPKEYPGARRIARLTWAEALAFADAGCDLVQRAALAAARAARLALTVRGFAGEPGTLVAGECPSDADADHWAAIRDVALAAIRAAGSAAAAQAALFGRAGLLTTALPTERQRSAFERSPFHRAIADALNECSCTWPAAAPAGAA